MTLSTRMTLFTRLTRLNTASLFSEPARAVGALRQWGLRAVVAAGVLATVACAPVKPAATPEYPVGRARLALPEGTWEDLGQSTVALPVRPAPGTIPLQTRAVGLRGADKELLAVALVQTNSTNYPREQTLWTGTCPRQDGVWVEDAAQASPVRVDCLRLKRWANNRDWLDKNQPELVRWMADHKVTFTRPVSHLNYRYATQGGVYVDIQAVVDQRLLRPPTRNNHEFLAAGRPGQTWSHALAQAARQSAALMDGALVIPAFPIAFPIALSQ